MEDNWNTLEKDTHRGLLDGTIENHECDPQENCPECRGSGQCVECHGQGDVNCHTCHGTGQCRSCHGQGRTRCTECGGSGRCRKCGGSGQILCRQCHGRGQIPWGNSTKTCDACGGGGYAPCPNCSPTWKNVGRSFFGVSGDKSGTGQCPKCEGTGELVCKKCNGSGNCTSCGGSGRETCQNCYGSGGCPTCDATGRVTCHRCEGSGWYQTFSTFDSKCYVKKWKYVSLEELKEGLVLADKRPVYKDIYRKWRYKGVIDFDKTEEMKSRVKNNFGNDETFKSYEAAYNKAVSTSEVKDTPYEKSVNMGRVPITKVDFTLNNKGYSVYVMGDNGVVMCEELPNKIEMYKLSFFQNLKMSFTRKKRHLSYIKLAAYIFQCDGRDMNESHVLDVFVDALKYKPAKQEKFKEQLEQYNANMPYETFRKEISSLFSSKKTLSFAWQCMAVDKKVSKQEEDLFAKIVAEYKKLDASEVETMKRFASKYSLLKDEYLVSEYLNK